MTRKLQIKLRKQIQITYSKASNKITQTNYPEILSKTKDMLNKFRSKFSTSTSSAKDHGFNNSSQ